MTGYDDYRTWTPAAQQKALERLRAAANDTWRPFYCTRHPCDGDPHGDWAWTHARTDQHPPPGDWNTWLSIAGRGAGKTRLGSEYAHRVVEQVPRIIIVAPTSGDLRDVIVEGESGILATARPGTRPDFEPTKRRLTWPNGAQALLISAEEPERLRGPQSYWAWCVAEGTLITTRSGQEPIQSVRPGQQVLTRAGWRTVTAVHDNGTKPVRRIEATDGTELIATGDHLVATPDGWVQMQHLEPGAVILAACSTTDPRHGSNGAVAATTDCPAAQGTTATRADGCSTATSTKTSTDRSPTATRSTTSTATPRTTTRTTSPCSPSPSTAPSPTVSAWPQAGTTGRPGRAPMPAGPGSTPSGPNGSRRNGSAPSAPAATSALLRSPSTAGRTAPPKRVASNSPHPPRRVYDLTVEGEHEYVANGIVVHNCDELATYPKPEDLWSNLVLGLRLGRRPRSLVTTTPKPIPLLKRLIADPRNTITRATTYDNVANLAPSFTEEIVKQYEGTRVGRQELHAEMLADVEGALWTWELIEASRDPGPPEGMQRIVVAVDPAGTSNRRSDETGIVVAGISGDHIYILADRSGRYTPHGWASEAGRLYDAWEADAIVPEVNYGADMVTSTLRSSGIKARITPVVATRGKQVRAEPVVALYEQGRCRLAGSFPKLEQEMAEWVPGEGASPNRVDAMVWAVTALDKRTAKAHIGTHRHLRAVV